MSDEALPAPTAREAFQIAQGKPESVLSASFTLCGMFACISQEAARAARCGAVDLRRLALSDALAALEAAGFWMEPMVALLHAAMAAEPMDGAAPEGEAAQQAAVMLADLIPRLQQQCVLAAGLAHGDAAMERVSMAVGMASHPWAASVVRHERLN